MRKLLTLALMPLGLVFCLIAAGLVFKKRWLVVAGLALLMVASTPVVGNGLVSILERQYPLVEVADCPRADAVVVLGGVVSDSRGSVESIEWSDAVDRFLKGLFLVQAGKAPALVLSGGDLPWAAPEYTGAVAMRDTAVRFGLASDAIHMIRGVANTADEARAVKALASEKGWEKLVLVTSAFHMPRASMLCRREGIEVFPFPADYQFAARRPLRATDLVPQADGLSKAARALKEFYGLAYYRLFDR
ncbi:MAG: YdcF family protein [bacterium]|nr:YdcF family protein [bacterium]